MFTSQFPERRTWRYAGWILTLLLLLPAAARAQQSSSQSDPLPIVTRAYAIEHARIITAPGRELERGTVVVRNGLIEAVGRDVRIPSDAERISGDSLVIYAGFIDGLSMAGIPAPEGNGDGRQRVERPGDPPYDVAGIQPQRRAASMVAPTERSIEELRNQGFAAAHVVPHGLSMPGSGAVIMLGGRDARRMILDDDASFLMQFEGARGVYPSTDMAVIARIRQLYREAERRSAVQQIYEDDPRGLERPPVDEVYSAFYPVIGGEKPVVFYTGGSSGALQIHRALDLQRQLGFPLIIAGANQAFDAIEPIREGGHPIILTLDLPEEPKSRDTTRTTSDSLKAVTPEAPSSHFVSDLRTQSFADVDAERDNLTVRQRMERDRYAAAASDLHRAGIRFAFSTRDVKPADIQKNLRLMIQQGLPEDAALAALTTNPASILGVDRHLGTVEEGKIANLVITNGPLFDERTQIRQVFVDGMRYEVKPQRSAADRDTTQADQNPTGEWSYTAATPDVETTGVLSIRRDSGRLEGTITIDGRPGAFDLTDASVRGNRLTFRFDARGVGSFSASVRLDGDRFEGALEVPDRGDFPMSGQRMFGPTGR